MTAVARVVRRSATRYEVFIAGQYVGDGNTLGAGQRLAGRHVPVKQWDRSRNEDGLWTGKAAA